MVFQKLIHSYLFQDMLTIVLSFLITDVVITLIMIVLWLQNSTRFKGTHLWVINFSLQTVAVALIALRGIIPDFFSVLVANASVLTGFIFGLRAMEFFTGQKSRYLLNFGLLLLFMAVQTYFTIFRSSLPERNLNISIFMLLLSAQYCYIIFFKTTGSTFKLTRGVGYIFAGYCLVNAARIANFFLINSTNNDYMKSGAFEQAVFVSYHILFILLTYDLALMYNGKLLHDITSQEEKFSRAFHSSPYGIIIARFSDNRIIDINEGFAKMTGYEYSEATRCTFSELNLYSDPGEQQTITDLLYSGSIFERETEMRRKSGELITCLQSSELIYINDERCILSSINDITEKKNSGRLLREKMKALEQMNKFMVGRELRMIELKKEINDLCNVAGIADKY